MGLCECIVERGNFLESQKNTRGERNVLLSYKFVYFKLWKLIKFQIFFLDFFRRKKKQNPAAPRLY